MKKNIILYIVIVILACALTGSWTYVKFLDTFLWTNY